MSGTYYPSCVVNLRLRFDEALHIVPVPAPESDAARAAAPPTSRDAAPDLLPLILRTGEENVSFVMGRVPKKANIELPGYRQAGTFNLTFDFKELPIDPRTVRACGVEIHLGTIEPGEFAAGMRGRDVWADGVRSSVLNTRTPSGGIRQDTLVMVGTMDEWKPGHGETGSIVTIVGRDMRGILLDSPLDPLALEHLDAGADVLALVRQILDFHPMGDSFVVEANAGEWPNGHLPCPMGQDMVPRHRRGAKGARSGGRANTSHSQMSYWDAIVRYCFLVGAIPTFRGSTLQIRPSRSIFDQGRGGIDPRIATPFEGGRQRTVGDGLPFSVRRLVYGRDVQELHVERKFTGRTRPKVIRCISVNPSGSITGDEAPTDITGPDDQSPYLMSARWPPAGTTPRAAAARTTSVAPSGSNAHEEIVNIPVPGITNYDRLLEVARGLYEEVGRQELGGSARTKDLGSFGGSNADPDLLRLRPGDGVVLLTDVRALSSRSPLVSTLTDNARAPFEQQVREVAERIGDENLARVIVATARGQVLELQRFFRVSNVKYEWDVEKGMDVSFDFQNYFVHRYGSVNTTENIPTAAPTRSVSARRTAAVPRPPRRGVR